MLPRDTFSKSSASDQLPRHAEGDPAPPQPATGSFCVSITVAFPSPLPRTDRQTASVTQGKGEQGGDANCSLGAEQQREQNSCKSKVSNPATSRKNDPRTVHQCTPHFRSCSHGCPQLVTTHRAARLGSVHFMCMLHSGYNLEREEKCSEASKGLNLLRSTACSLALWLESPTVSAQP